MSVYPLKYVCNASRHPLLNAASGRGLSFKCEAFGKMLLAFFEVANDPGYCESFDMKKPKMLFCSYMSLSYEKICFSNINS
jgi:hypothetical protein